MNKIKEGRKLPFEFRFHFHPAFLLSWKVLLSVLFYIWKYFSNPSLFLSRGIFLLIQDFLVQDFLVQGF